MSIFITATFTLLFEPSATVSLESFSATRDFLVLQTLDTVKSRYIFWQYQDGTEGGVQGWTSRGAEESKILSHCCVIFCINLHKYHGNA